MKNVIILLLCLLAFAGCKKNNEPQLPEATHSGANTFGCKINGEPFVTSGDPPITWDNIGVKFSYNYDSSISIYAKQAIPIKYIDMRFKFSSSPGIYSLYGENQYGGAFTDLSNGSTAVTGNNEYNTDSLHRGVVNVTYYNGYIIAGTFSFDAMNDSSQVVHVTEGRFDIKRQ